MFLVREYIIMGFEQPKNEEATEQEVREGYNVSNKEGSFEERMKSVDKQFEEDKKNKEFKAMSLEQREEEEYKRDKERGFTVKDSRTNLDNAVNLDEYKAKKAELEAGESMTEEKSEEPIIEEVMKEATPEQTEPEQKTQPEIRPEPLVGWKQEMNEVEDEIGKLEAEVKSLEVSGSKLFVQGKRKELLDALEASEKKLDKLSRTEVRGGAVDVNLKNRSDELKGRSNMIKRNMEGKNSRGASGIVGGTWRAIKKLFM